MTRAMRIGLFTNNYLPLVNGLATSADTFAREFRRAGHEVVVVAPRYPGHQDKEVGVLRVPGLRAPTHHAYVLPLAWWPGVARTRKRPPSRSPSAAASIAAPGTRPAASACARTGTRYRAATAAAAPT